MKKGTNNQTFEEESSKLFTLLEKPTTDSFVKANYLREMSVGMFQKSVEIGHTSQQSASILLEDVQKYRDLCMKSGPNEIDNYTAQCLKLLQPSYQFNNFTNFKTSLTNPAEFLEKIPNTSQCILIDGKITDENIERIFNNKNVDNCAQNLNFRAEPMQDETTISRYICTDYTNNESLHKKIDQNTTQVNPLTSSKFVLRQPSQKLLTESDNSVHVLKKSRNVFDKLLYRDRNNITENKQFRPSMEQVTPQINHNFEIQSSKFDKISIDDPSNNQMSQKRAAVTGFRTGNEELLRQNQIKYGNASGHSGTDHQPNITYGTTKKSLGARRNVYSKFVSPISSSPTESAECNPKKANENEIKEPIDERLKNIDPKMVELIQSEIMDNFCKVSWEDIAGLEYAKATIKEAVVWPILRPDIFTGLRRPPRGILLFGPPGTGKTLIGKCIASQSKSTFFSISASSLTSKWIGDSEKMVRALFAVASVHQPAVVFIDEIDSLLCQRSETEHESSRRLKTEFLVQLDGATTSEDERILIVGATNRPQELDEAARRRLVKRLYIPLPEREAREQILRCLLKSERSSITEKEIERIGILTDGFSGADMKTLCHEASMGPIRSITMDQMESINVADVRPVCFDDFSLALKRVRASVSPDDLNMYVKWNTTYGSGAGK